jgi:hypothetical protein
MYVHTYIIPYGTDEDEAWARRMDDWIVWEVREEAVVADLPFSFFLSVVYIPLRGDKAINETQSLHHTMFTYVSGKKTSQTWHGANRESRDEGGRATTLKL